MKPKLGRVPSRPEISLFSELQKAGLGQGALLNKEICLARTTVSVFYPEEGLAVYLRRYTEKEDVDVDVDKALEALGIRVLRVSYESEGVRGISKEKLEAVVGKVKEVLSELGR
jgi:hypothetical protein